MSRLFWLCLLFVMACLVSGAYVVPWWENYRWESNVRAVEEGMSLDEIIKKLGPGQLASKSMFQTGEKNEGVTSYYHWQRTGWFGLEVGVKDGKAKTVQIWRISL